MVHSLRPPTPCTLPDRRRDLQLKPAANPESSDWDGGTLVEAIDFSRVAGQRIHQLLLLHSQVALCDYGETT